MSRACLLLFFSGFVQQTARTRPDVSCLDGVPTQTSPAAPERSPENDLRLPDAGILRWYRPHSGPPPRRLAHISCARPPPRDRKHNADRYWQGSAKSPNLVEYLSLFPTTGLPPSLQR